MFLTVEHRRHPDWTNKIKTVHGHGLEHHHTLVFVSEDTVVQLGHGVLSRVLLLTLCICPLGHGGHVFQHLLIILFLSLKINLYIKVVKTVSTVSQRPNTKG
jgi:hypothetical protein